LTKNFEKYILTQFYTFGKIHYNSTFLRKKVYLGFRRSQRVSDQAVQNTPVVYYTVGIKVPAAGFFIAETCCRVFL